MKKRKISLPRHLNNLPRNAETECDDATTDDESEHGEDYEGKFDDNDFEGIVFVQKDVVCNLQEKANIPNK